MDTINISLVDGSKTTILVRSVADKNFDGANLSHADLHGQRFDGANFADTLLDDANLDGCDCSTASFYRARLHRASMKYGVFAGVDFQLADLQNADVRSADFSSVNSFVRTDFSHADLSGIIWNDAKFSGAKYDEGTIFPEGFDPFREGMEFKSSKK